MRDFNKVLVIALPRCATVSMTDALGTLGCRVAHLGKIHGESAPEHHNAERLICMHEQIAVGQFRMEVLQECDGLADYPACIPHVFENLDQQYPGSLFINVRRDRNLQAWLQSVERQFIGLQLVKTGYGSAPRERAFMRTMTSFRQMTFGQAEFEPDVYCRAYGRHQREIQRYFAGRKDALLDIPDVSLLQEHGFRLLCEFLRCDQPRTPFPRSNSHSLAPERAFFEKLRAGEIASRTGIQPEVSHQDAESLGPLAVSVCGGC